MRKITRLRVEIEPVASHCVACVRAPGGVEEYLSSREVILSHLGPCKVARATVVPWHPPTAIRDALMPTVCATPCNHLSAHARNSCLGRGLSDDMIFSPRVTLTRVAWHVV